MCRECGNKSRFRLLPLHLSSPHHSSLLEGLGSSLLACWWWMTATLPLLWPPLGGVKVLQKAHLSPTPPPPTTCNPHCPFISVPTWLANGCISPHVQLPADVCTAQRRAAGRPACLSVECCVDIFDCLHVVQPRMRRGLKVSGQWLVCFI